MPKFICFLVALVCVVNAFAQNVLNGIVLDAYENPISNVKIEEVGSSHVTYSNFDGSFSLEFYSEEDKLLFSHYRYDSLKLNFNKNRDLIIFLNLSIDQNPYNLDGYVGFVDFKKKVPKKNLENMPYFLGHSDINRQLQMMPGIEHGREGFSNLFVRGGDVDQNLMLYNGTPIYNFNHLFGVASVFHSRSIANTGVYKGIAPAKYGGRTSSVIELESPKSAEFSGLDGEFEMNPLSAGIYIESINKNKNYFTISGRRTWIDLLFPTESRQNDFNFNFYDFQTNFGFKLDNGDQLDFSVMNTRDLYFLSFSTERDSLNSEASKYNYTQKWSNVLASVKYSQELSKKMSAEHSVHFSDYKSTIILSEEVLLNDFSAPNPFGEEQLQRGVRDFIGRSNWNYALSNWNNINFGIQSSARTFLIGRYNYSSRNYPGLEDANEDIGNQKFETSLETSAYAEVKFQKSDNFIAHYGGRATFYNFQGFNQFVLEPRLHARYAIDHKSVLKFSYNKHNQFVNQLNLGESGSIRNIWVPSTERIKPQSSNVAEIGYERLVGKNYALSANLYYKTINNLSTISNLDDVSNPSNDWQNAVFQGSGTSYGLELMFQKNEGYITGWVSYAFGKSDRNFPDLFEDDFLFDHDRTHMAKLYVNLLTYGEWNCGLNYLIGSGQLYTLPIGKFTDLSGNTQLEYNTLNNYRSPLYTRLDLSVIRVKDLGGVEQQWKFYLYNALGSRNPLNINATFEAGLTGLTIERNYLAFVPGVAYLLKF
jgi:hypothetical protein